MIVTGYFWVIMVRKICGIIIIGRLVRVLTGFDLIFILLKRFQSIQCLLLIEILIFILRLGI